MYIYTCTFCGNRIERNDQTRVVRKDKRMFFYHVTPDCRAAHTNELDRAHQIAMHDAWEDVDVDFGLHNQ